MPRGFVDDSEGDIADEEVNDCRLGYDILTADADGINVLLLNVRQHHAAAVTDDLCQGIDSKSIGCVPKSLLHVRSVHVLAFIRKSDIALCDGNGVHGLAVQQYLPLPGLGVLFSCCRLSEEACFLTCSPAVILRRAPYFAKLPSVQ